MSRFRLIVCIAIAREALFSQFNFDLRAFCKFLQQQTDQPVKPGKLLAPSRAQSGKGAKKAG